MLIVMHSHATPDQIESVQGEVRRLHLTPHPLPMAVRVAPGSGSAACT